MAITPDTNLTLIKLPIELDSNNQLTFASATAQHTYFDGLTDNLDAENFTYQRKDSVIRYPAHMDSIINYNYCMYQNENYGNKWFYAFITDMRYINDNMTEITIDTDAWQTWQFDITLNNMFVEREIVAKTDDVFGKYRIDEGLEIGELIHQATGVTASLNPYYVIAYTGDTVSDGVNTVTIPSTKGLSINGIPSSVPFIICDTIANYISILKGINDLGLGNNIITCFTVPKASIEDVFQNGKMNGSTSISLNCCILSDGSYSTAKKSYSIGHHTSFYYGPGKFYTPKNKKLLQYPYMYFGTGGGTTDNKIYRYEDFYDTTGAVVPCDEGVTYNLTFDIISEFNPSPDVLLVPRGYKNYSNNATVINDILEPVKVKGYPTLAYYNDVFNSWLAQNTEIMDLNMQQQEFNYWTNLAGNLSNVIGGLGALGSGDIGGGLGTLGSSLASSVRAGVDLEFYARQQMAQKNQQKLMPDQVNLSSSATLMGYGLMSTNLFNHYEINEEYAKRIDNYFSAYGYKVNEIKVPNINSRNNWNYIKTAGANIHADIPQRDLETIKNMFNSGITFWHNPATFLDYTQTNA
ncbi:MAG: hypothetical protein IIT65_09850 [Lachnospiraceae bacterium]|nr:hypothetical protein [Lachnospiraceae bacterium]